MRDREKEAPAAEGAGAGAGVPWAEDEPEANEGDMCYLLFTLAQVRTAAAPWPWLHAIWAACCPFRMAAAVARQGLSWGQGPPTGPRLPRRPPCPTCLLLHQSTPLPPSARPGDANSSLRPLRSPAARLPPLPHRLRTHRPPPAVAGIPGGAAPGGAARARLPAGETPPRRAAAARLAAPGTARPHAVPVRCPGHHSRLRPTIRAMPCPPAPCTLQGSNPHGSGTLSTLVEGIRYVLCASPTSLQVGWPGAAVGMGKAFMASGLGGGGRVPICWASSDFVGLFRVSFQEFSSSIFA